MKVLSSPQSPGQRSMRRVSKPLMEKRRRERINHSLETLRLLMLESTHNEKLKNPKVEKAEILESVVQFLQSEPEVDHQVLTKQQSRARRNSYQDGMRTCLLRVSRFVASKGPDSEGTSGDNTLQASFALAEPMHAHSPPHRQIHRALIPAAVADPAALGPQHLSHHRQPVLTQVTGLHCETRKLISSSAASIHITDPVWRPWPQ